MKCQQCGNDFTPYVGRQRFCCRECSDAWFANERREAVRRYRSESPSNYFEMEAARDDSTAALAGSTQPMPFAAPAWSRDAALLPAEPPLGWDVNELPDCSGIGGREAIDGEA